MTGRVVSRLRPRLPRASAESGAISAMVVTLIVMLFVLAGLVVDGGFAINARQSTFDDAEQAARAGANQIDMEQLRATGTVVILKNEAMQAATEYMMARGYQPGRVQVDVGPAQVTVTAERTVETSLLQLIFISSFEVEGTATSRPAVGITGEVL